MIHFKACPRCVGDLELRHEYGEWIVRCVQCGWEYEGNIGTTGDRTAGVASIRRITRRGNR